MKKIEFWEKTALGVPTAIVLAMLLSLISGNFGSFLIIIRTILFTVICTFGLALIIYIPILFIIGSITSMVFKAIRDWREGSGPQKNKPAAKPSRDLKAARNYILKAKGRGYADEKIFGILINAGWSEEVVKEAFSEPAA